MIKPIIKTGERIIPFAFESKEEYLIYLCHLFAYEFARNVIPKSTLVLDVGFGEGYGTSLLSQKVSKVIGLDIDESVVEYALKKYGDDKCVFATYDGKKIPYKDSLFDAVVSFQVIEHIEDDTNYVSEIYRVLKKRGVFILTTPNKIFRLKPNQKPWNKFHKREYCMDELKSVLKNKFQDTRIWGIYGNKEIQEVERKRIKNILKAVSLDFLDLRELLPKSISSIIIKTWRKIVSKNNKNENFFAKYGTEDFYIVKNGKVDDSLNLLGISRKLKQ